MLCLVCLVPLVGRGAYAYLLPLAQLCGIYAIIATGLTLLMGFGGQVSLGHAGFYAFGAYAAAVSVTQLRAPFGVAILVALAAGSLLAFVAGFMVLRLRGHFLALATLCLGIIIIELISKSRITGGAAGLFDLPPLDCFGILGASPLRKAYFIWLVAGFVVLLAVNLTTSPLGRAIQAIHSDEDSAAALGVPVFRIKLMLFVFSGLLASVAGVLYAFVYSPSYLGPEEFSLMLSVMLVTMVVVGGMRSVWGGVIGAILMTSLHEMITLGGEKLGFTQISRFEQLIFGVLLVLMLRFCPNGILPTLERFLARRKTRRAHGLTWES
jgi:branched-chain amino acid transport system permease protein